MLNFEVLNCLRSFLCNVIDEFDDCGIVPSFLERSGTRDCIALMKEDEAD
jgi:hypothetical protein